LRKIKDLVQTNAGHSVFISNATIDRANGNEISMCDKSLCCFIQNFSGSKNPGTFENCSYFGGFVDSDRKKGLWCKFPNSVRFIMEKE